MALNAEASTGRWLPSHIYSSLEDASSALGFLISCYSAPGHPQHAPYVLAVVHQATGRLLGHVGFSPLGSEVEVSYAIAEASRCHGYGTEALAHACHWLARTFNLSQVLAVTASANTPSRRVLERAGFVQAHEEVMVFQGHEQKISRYYWRTPERRGRA